MAALAAGAREREERDAALQGTEAGDCPMPGPGALHAEKKRKRAQHLARRCSTHAATLLVVFWNAFPGRAVARKHCTARATAGLRCVYGQSPACLSAGPVYVYGACPVLSASRGLSVEGLRRRRHSLAGLASALWNRVADG